MMRGANESIDIPSRLHTLVSAWSVFELDKLCVFLERFVYKLNMHGDFNLVIAMLLLRN